MSIKYEVLDFTPPKAVASAAAMGLEYREKAGGKGGLTPSQAAKEGIGSGVQRAINLKNRDKLSPETVKRMKAFFSRHQKNKGIASEFKGTPWKDRGYVAWLLWGGDPGRAWAENMVDKMNKIDERNKMANRIASTLILGGNMASKSKGKRSRSRSSVSLVLREAAMEVVAKEKGWPKTLEKGRFTTYCKTQGFEGPCKACAEKALDSDDASVRGMASFYLNTTLKRK